MRSKILLALLCYQTIHAPHRPDPRAGLADLSLQSYPYGEHDQPQHAPAAAAGMASQPAFGAVGQPTCFDEYDQPQHAPAAAAGMASQPAFGAVSPSSYPSAAIATTQSALQVGATAHAGDDPVALNVHVYLHNPATSGPLVVPSEMHTVHGMDRSASDREPDATSVDSSPDIAPCFHFTDRSGAFLVRSVQRALNSTLAQTDCPRGSIDHCNIRQLPGANVLYRALPERILQAAPQPEYMNAAAQALPLLPRAYPSRPSGTAITATREFPLEGFRNFILTVGTALDPRIARLIPLPQAELINRLRITDLTSIQPNVLGTVGLILGKNCIQEPAIALKGLNYQLLLQIVEPLDQITAFLTKLMTQPNISQDIRTHIAVLLALLSESPHLKTINDTIEQFKPGLILRFRNSVRQAIGLPTLQRGRSPASESVQRPDSVQISEQVQVMPTAVAPGAEAEPVASRPGLLTRGANALWAARERTGKPLTRAVQASAAAIGRVAGGASARWSATDTQQHAPVPTEVVMPTEAAEQLERDDQAAVRTVLDTKFIKALKQEDFVVAIQRIIQTCETILNTCGSGRLCVLPMMQAELLGLSAGSVQEYSQGRERPAGGGQTQIVELAQWLAANPTQYQDTSILLNLVSKLQDGLLGLMTLLHMSQEQARTLERSALDPLCARALQAVPAMRALDLGMYELYAKPTVLQLDPASQARMNFVLWNTIGRLCAGQTREGILEFIKGTRLESVPISYTNSTGHDVSCARFNNWIRTNYEDSVLFYIDQNILDRVIDIFTASDIPLPECHNDSDVD